MPLVMYSWKHDLFSGDEEHVKALGPMREIVARALTTWERPKESEAQVKEIGLDRGLYASNLADLEVVIWASTCQSRVKNLQKMKDEIETRLAARLPSQNHTVSVSIILADSVV